MSAHVALTAVASCAAAQRLLEGGSCGIIHSLKPRCLQTCIECWTCLPDLKGSRKNCCMTFAHDPSLRDLFTGYRWVTRYTSVNWSTLSQNDEGSCPVCTAPMKYNTIHAKIKQHANSEFTQA